MVAIMMVLFSSCRQKEKASSDRNAIVGVYQYIDGREGLSIITDRYFIFSGRWQHDPLPEESEAYYEKEYKTLFIEAGTWTMQDSIITCKLLFGKNPSAVETSFRFTFTFRGDTAIFHILNKNGEVTGKGSTLKLKQTKATNDIVGVYQYTGNEDGLCIMTEDYFIFTARNNSKFSEEDSTDLYINKYKSLFMQAGTYTRQDSIITSNLLYAKNPSQEGKSYKWAYSFRGDTVVTGFVKENGAVSWSDYLIKLE